MQQARDDFNALAALLCWMFVCGAVAVIAVLYQLYQIRRQLVATNQGLTDLNAAVAADTAEVTAEQAAFTALETEINTLIAAGPGEVTDAQLETLAQTLQAAQAARVAAVNAANAAIPPTAQGSAAQVKKS